MSTQATRPKVLVTRRMPDHVMSRIQSECDVLYHDSTSPIPRADLLAKIGGVDALFCMLSERVDGEVLQAAGSSLKAVCTMSVGYDHVDVAALRAAGVALGHTPGVLSDTTADLAMAILLALQRRVREANLAVHDGSWSDWEPFWMCGTDLHHSTVGIVGLGRIGEAFGRRVRGFGCNVIYTGPREKKAAAAALDAEYVSMQDLLARSDVVSVHAPLTPETTELFNADAFKQMKPNAFLVNTSRGGLVNQDDLVEALSSGTIAGAALDVTTPEPLSPEHALLKMPNCLVVPHIGSATMATRNAMAEMTVENVLAAVRGEALPHAVAL